MHMSSSFNAHPKEGLKFTFISQLRFTVSQPTSKPERHTFIWTTMIDTCKMSEMRLNKPSGDGISVYRLIQDWMSRGSNLRPFSCKSSMFTILPWLCITYEPEYIKTNKMTCTLRRLRSAYASTQSDQSSLCTQWVAQGPRFLHADSEDSDQTGQADQSLCWAHR